MNELQIALGVAALLLAMWIASRQHMQLQRLKRIGQETSETAKKLKADTHIQEVVQRFFSMGQTKDQQYKCVFPVSYDQRPLPSIVAGDYYALHVLQTLIGSDSLELCPLAQSNSASSVTGTPPTENTIYLCAPSANPALAQLAPAIDLSDDNPAKPTLAGITLPCWFGFDKDRNNDPVKKIWIVETNNKLISGAEEDYARALLQTGIPELGPRQQDYGILLRLSVGDCKLIVLAGIHQYGTWIVGEFLKRIATSFPVTHSQVFESDDDFLAVIWGEFNPKRFCVTRCDVLQEYLWVRQGQDQWVRIRSTSDSPGL